jgi:hypothetical protein
MKHRWLIILFLFVLMVLLAGNAQATTSSSKNQSSLIYVKISSADDLNRFGRTRLPMYAVK